VTSWSTPAQALSWTGEELDQVELDRAGAIVELYAGVTLDQPADSISAVDRRWLAQTEAYQAVWMRGKPGFLTQRESHTDTSADGVRVGRASDSQIMLAPLAARCLKNLSWLGTRTVNHAGPVRPKGSFLAEEADAAHSWTPLPIA
jgi:hypothetical protein